MGSSTDLLIVGAGPFGLAMAAHAADRHIPYQIVGRPMDLWRTNMPEQMILRSHCDWHLDPADVHTIDRFLIEQDLDRSSVEPLSRNFYLDYAEWFRQQKGIEPVADLVQRLDVDDDGFHAALESGQTLHASNVVLAIGFRYFQHLPAELTKLLPPGRYVHTCELVDFNHLKGKRCLIVGGRQSAFEWAALLAEAGAHSVHVVHRHVTPQFTDSEWGWINAMTERFVSEPGWYRRLAGEEQAEVQAKFAEARIKLEPWLWPRIDNDTVQLWPENRVVTCRENGAGALTMALRDGTVLEVDHIVLATGYRVDMTRVPFLAAGNVLRKLQLADGYPVLDEHFESNIPGLFITSLPATKDFGPFFAFTVGVKASAKVITTALH